MNQFHTIAIGQVQVCNYRVETLPDNRMPGFAQSLHHCDRPDLMHLEYATDKAARDRIVIDNQNRKLIELVHAYMTLQDFVFSRHFHLQEAPAACAAGS